MVADFGVIVLGVLTALALESAWQGWQDASLGADYLLALRQEAAENVSLVRRAVQRSDSLFTSLEGVAATVSASEIEGKERELAVRLQRAARTSHDVALRRAVFNDLQSTGNLRLIGDPELRQHVSGRYSTDQGAVDRMNASASRVGSGLYHLIAGYEGRYGLSGPGVPTETNEGADDFLRQVVSDPSFEAELGREIRRHAIAQFYLQRLLDGLEDYLRVLEQAGGP